MPSLESFTLRNVIRKSRIWIDRCRGLDFLRTIEPEEVGLDPHYSFRSCPSGNRYLEKVLAALDITENDSIIDIGCGKGSAMRTMLKFPFAKIDGLELSEQIAEIAIKNFKKLKTTRCDVFICNASEFGDYDGYNMIYAYNPFPCSIMSQVVDNLIQSIRRCDREVVIVYDNPTCDDVIVNQARFSKIWDYPDEWGNRIYIYSNFSIQRSRMNR
jgi:hypothetical protein